MRPGYLGSALALLLLLAAEAGAIDVLVRGPRAGQPVFGVVEVVMEVLSAEPVEAVEVRLDGETVGLLTRPPWQLTVDVGQENLEHRFEITARDIYGAEAHQSVVTGRLEVDMEYDVELMQLYVTVTRESGRALDLERQAFEVEDESEAQDLVTFESGEVPFTAVLLLDTSRSMKGERLDAALEAADRFVANMSELDEAMVMLFSDRLLRATSFTGDPEILAAELEGVEAAGGTALNDHLYLALKILEARQGRRVVILLSDGVDIESSLAMEDLLWKAARSQAIVYWVRPGDGSSTAGRSWSSAWRDAETQRREYDRLHQVVEESGGRVYDIQSLEEVPLAFQEILEELREQYVLGYYPSRNLGDGSWHRVRVKVRGRGLMVRTREGYVDF